MKRSSLLQWLVVFAPVTFSACATISPPLPPSLNLPAPPSDLCASRKGNHVNLVWTVPAKTTDRQLLRDVGPTFICRGLEDLKNCGKPVATTPPQILATSST